MSINIQSFKILTVGIFICACILLFAAPKTAFAYAYSQGTYYAQSSYYAQSGYSIAGTSANLGATVTSNGGATLTARGTCWGTITSPTTNCLAEGGITIGVFTHLRTGFPAGTLIYYRGYATNSAFTERGYSGTGSFTTGVAAVAPTASLSASPNPVAYGARSTLTWGSTNATSCTAGGPWSNASAPLGPGSGLTDPLTTNTTFTFQCIGSDGSISPLASVTITVACTGGCTSGGCDNGATNPPACSTFTPPTASLWATPPTIDTGQSSTLTWSSNAVSCVGVGFNTGYASSDNVSVSPSTTSSYQVTCYSGANGTGTPSPVRTATVTVLQPTASISASPTRVQTGSTSTITWSATQVTSCAISGTNGFSGSGLSNPIPAPTSTITGQTTFTITCQTNGSPVTNSVIVNVIPIFREF